MQEVSPEEFGLSEEEGTGSVATTDSLSGVPAVAHSETRLKPLFDQIEQYGERPESLINIEELLKELGVNEELRKNIASFSKTHLRFLGLVYRRPLAPEDDVKPQGRGVFHKISITINGEKRFVYIYTKGSGNVSMVQDMTPQGTTPGYPVDSEHQFMADSFSPTAPNPHPRIMGTETLSWGFLEILNAAVVFAEIAREREWTNITQAIEAGVTIPIGFLRLPKLSQRMQHLLRERMRSHPEERDYLSWFGNFIDQGGGHGVVGLIVPSDQRVGHGARDILSRAEIEAEQRRSVDPKNSAIRGRTLRKLLEMGYYYSLHGADGRNEYASTSESDILLAQADNSDLMLIGELPNDPIIRAKCIFNELIRDSGLAPPFLPDPERQISFEEVSVAQRYFWEQFLGGIADPRAIEILPRLMPLLNMRIKAAVALFVHEKLSSKRWGEVAKKRRRILRKFDRFKTKHELDSDISQELADQTRYGLKEFRNYADRKRDLFGVPAILEFLETGDARLLLSHPNLRRSIEQTEQILAITDKTTRDRLLIESAIH